MPRDKRDKARSRALVMSSARREFLENGYERASMRAVARNAGLTAGALYKHFGGKEEMFAALVEPVYEELVRLYEEHTRRALAVFEQDGVESYERKSAEGTDRVLDFVYRHFDEFRLMFNCSAGTRMEDIRDRMVRLEMDSSEALMEAARRRGVRVQVLSEKERHIFFTMSLTPLFEAISHAYSYEEAADIIHLMSRAQNYAWERIIQLRSEGGA